MNIIASTFLFYWPITVGTVVISTAVYLYCLSVREGHKHARSIQYALAGLLAVIVGLAPLVPTVGGVRCNEEGHLRTFDPEWFLILLSLSVAFVLLWSLYTLVGRSPAESWIPALITVGLTGLSLMVEFVISEATAEAACSSFGPAWYAQVGLAVVCAGVAGGAIGMSMLSGVRR